VGPKAILDVVVKRKIPNPHRELNLDHPDRNPTLLYQIPPLN
jgi:hypothetical protein